MRFWNTSRKCLVRWLVLVHHKVSWSSKFRVKMAWGVEMSLRREGSKWCLCGWKQLKRDLAQGNQTWGRVFCFIYHLDKSNWHFGQICFVFWTNTAWKGFGARKSDVALSVLPSLPQVFGPSTWLVPLAGHLYLSSKMLCDSIFILIFWQYTSAA